MVARKAATTTATKPAPKAATKPKTPVVVDDEEDLLSGLGDAPAATQDEDEELDLLDAITEDQGDAWMPADDDEQPKGIQGKVISVSSVETDQKYGGGSVPLIEIQEKDGHVWSVRGYHLVLRNQLEKADPQVGDTIAIKYLGEKENKKKDNSYQNYGVACPRCDARK